MTFRLVEKTLARDGLKARKPRKDMPKTWPLPSKTVDKYNKLQKRSDKIDFIEEMVIPHPKFKRLFGLRQMIIDSILHYGLDIRKNHFLRFLGELNPKLEFPNKKERPKMQYIFDSWRNKKLDLSLPVLQNPSLYNRNITEFKYTLNAFNLFSNANDVSAYLKDPSKADTSQFLVKGTNPATQPIKEGGSSGKAGDTIYNVIEGWAKDNEYSPEEIAQNNEMRAKEEKEKADVKDTGKDGASSSGTSGGGTGATEWTYDYFKLALEKVFANAGQFKTSLGKKEPYLNRVFATFVLPELSPPSGLDNENNKNEVIADSSKDVNDGDVKKFGDPSKVDTPIYLNLISNGKIIPSAYVFHKLLPLDDNSTSYYKQVANKNLGNLKRHLHKIDPNDDANADTHLQKIVDAIGELSEIPHR